MDMSDESAGSCPMCRHDVKLSDLKRVCIIASEDGSEEEESGEEVIAA